jgi:hypothetical protein
VDYIIGNADDCGTIGAETQSAEERAFVGYFRFLSKSAQTALLQFMQNFIEK